MAVTNPRRSFLLVSVLLAVVLAPIAIGLQSTPANAQQASEEPGTDIVVRQGEQCYPLESFGNGSESVKDFYGYRSPFTEPRGWYHAYGELQGLLREDTSQILLYNGSEGLSLVFVNDGASTTAGSGGTVTIDVSGLPADGNWSVQDDSYPGQDDVFDVGGSTAHIEWYWNNGNRSDGAAFVGLGGDNWEEITIEPRFNEESAGYPYRKWDGPPESNEVTTWIARSANESAGTNASTDANGTSGNATDANGTNETDETDETDEAVNANETGAVAVGAANGTTSYELDMNEPVTVARGPCDDEPPAAALTASPDELLPGTEVTFDASGSADNDAIAEYRWDTDGDGTIETVTNESTLTTAYNRSGTFEPRVIVADRANNTATATVSLQVSEETTTTTTTSTTSTNTAAEGGETVSTGQGEPTDGASTPTTEEGSGGGSGSGLDVGAEAEQAVDRVSEQLAGMDNANLIGLAVLAVALLVIGLVVLRR